MSRFRHFLALTAITCAMFATSPATATTATGVSMPTWEQLTPAQRDLLVAPIRERWNTDPDERARFYQRAQRWQQMTPEQRTRAHHGMGRWEHMNPKKREEMRALFQKMRAMTPEQRKGLRDQWHRMTPEQRKAWMQANRPAADRP